MSNVTKDILKGLEEALSYAEGSGDESLHRVHVPATIDVRPSG